MNRLVTTVTALFAITMTTAAYAEAPPVTFDMHGYYWAQSNWVYNLFDGESPQARGSSWALPYKTPNRTFYLTMKGRFEPQINIGETVKVMSSIDVLDNVVWGDNENLAATPLFAGDPSNTQPDGSIGDALQLRRLWVEWTTKFGLLRIGRQPSHWGMGILANGGDGFDDDFGVNHDGSTYDRLIFATRPIDLVRGVVGMISGEDQPGPEQYPWIIAIGYDKLVESSAIRYQSNFPCTDGDPTNDLGCEEYADEDTYLSTDYENDANMGYRNNPIWLSDSGDDVQELILVSVFKQEGWQVSAKHTMDLTAGVYAVHRWQTETTSDVWIVDGYLNWKFMGIFVEAEGYKILGTSKAIAPKGDIGDGFECSFGDLMDNSWAHGDDSSCKAANITGYALRAGYDHDVFTAKFELGGASGDPDLLDPVYTGRQLHPDHNVGLILYQHVLPKLTSEAYADDDKYEPLWAAGGVYNSLYIFPRVIVRPVDMLDLRFGVLGAWADRAGGNTALPLIGDEQHDPAIVNGDTDDDGEMDSWQDKGLIVENRGLGVEFDAAIHLHALDEHVDVALEFGYLKASRRLQQALISSYSTEELNADPAIAQRLSNIFALQLRAAFIW